MFRQHVNIDITESKDVMFTFIDDSTENTIVLDAINFDVIELSLNNLNQPMTFVARKPAGVLEWAGFYKKFFVKKIEVECTFDNQADDPVIAGIALFPGTPEEFDPNQNFDWNTARSLPSNTLENKQVLMTGVFGGNTMSTIKCTADLTKLIGNSNYQSYLEYSGSLLTNNPLKLLNGFVYAITSNGQPGGVDTVVRYSLKMKLYTTLYQQKSLFVDEPPIPPILSDKVDESVVSDNMICTEQ